MNTSYIKTKKIGEGTYALIYLADEVQTVEPSPKIIKSDINCLKIKQVALKCIKVTKYATGLEISAIREIKALKGIRHKFILHLHEVFIYKNEIYLVLDYVTTNLELIIKNRTIIFMPSDIKAWLQMILKGLHACHRKFIMHRDLKPNNILITKNGIVKIADFGLARHIDLGNMTPAVVTRWYRAPELLLSCKHYSFGIDIWAVGCILSEMYLRVPLFGADDDISMLDSIFKLLGTPNMKSWPKIGEIENYNGFKHYESVPLKGLFTAACDDGIDLLEKMLSLDPLRRITCLNALKHPYFQSLPHPTEPHKLPYCEDVQE